MTPLILAIDQGTTGTTALLVDPDLEVVGRATVDFPQHYPRPGWVEHDPGEIWHSVRRAVSSALADARVPATAVAAIGLTNQRETTILWERNGGTPLGNAIVWQCRRSSDICRELRERGAEPRIRELTGLVLDPYFSASKIAWRLREEPQLTRRAENGEVCFGTVDSYLIWQLTGGAVHAIEVSNASRTLLFGLHSLTWEEELLDYFALPAALLPAVVPSAGQIGVTRGLDFLPDGIPIAGAAGDQQAALFGQACFAAGEAKCTYGTGAFLLANTGTTSVASRNGLLSTVAWQIGGTTDYALEGSAFIAGAAVQWLRDGLGLIATAADIEGLAASVPDSGGVIFVPALTGLGAPHWRSEARGLISGITRGTTAAHLARATLEGIALQIHDLATAMASDRGAPLTILKVDGGAARNDLLLQLQADLLRLPVVRPRNVETTALGAAMLAGLGCGLWNSRDDLSHHWKTERRVLPEENTPWRQPLLDSWREAVLRA